MQGTEIVHNLQSILSGNINNCLKNKIGIFFFMSQIYVCFRCDTCQDMEAHVYNTEDLLLYLPIRNYFIYLGSPQHW